MKRQGRRRLPMARRIKRSEIREANPLVFLLELAAFTMVLAVAYVLLVLLAQ